jgi:trehalose 6-phosphate synthase
VAHAAGSADLVAAAAGEVGVPPANHRYRVKHVALSDDEFRGYYYGFANEGLWPLCHKAGVKPVFRRADYEMYRAANTRFARAVAKEASHQSPIVLVQDYHFALAPQILRDSLPHSRVLAFWHIPWPHCRVLAGCPWAPELIEGLLGSDIVGLQTDDDCQNFLACVDALLPSARIDRQANTILYRKRRTVVRAYPVGVDCAHESLRSTPDASRCREWANHRLQLPPGVQLGVGVDRMDYTKGINEKFLAIEALLDTYPEFAGRFVYLQIAEPSRDCLRAYRAARDEAFNTCVRVNNRFASSGVPPIRFVEQHHEPADVYRYYRAADVCYVGSLHDGMNLVAKEFVAARNDEHGALVLSAFAGAARQLRAAISINPFRTERCAEALARALRMAPIEQTKRMRILRAEVAAFDASWWAEQVVQDARAIRPVAQQDAMWNTAVA